MELTKTASDLLILCQRELQHRDPKDKSKEWVKTAAGMEYFTDTRLLQELTVALSNFCASFESHPEPPLGHPS